MDEEGGWRILERVRCKPSPPNPLSLRARRERGSSPGGGGADLELWMVEDHDVGEAQERATRLRLPLSARGEGVGG